MPLVLDNDDHQGDGDPRTDGGRDMALRGVRSGVARATDLRRSPYSARAAADFRLTFSGCPRPRSPIWANFGQRPEKRKADPPEGKPAFSCDVMVGARGFEPPTPRSRTECSTRLSHAPTKDQVYPAQAVRARPD